MSQKLTFDPKWIRDKITDEMIAFARQEGEELAKKGLTKTQLRNFFGEVKIIESAGYKDARTRFLLLAPKIAYTVRRNYEKESKDERQRIRMEDSALGQFEKTFLKAYNEVKGNEVEQVARFSNFVDLMEALLAYHRYYAPEKDSDRGKK